MPEVRDWLNSRRGSAPVTPIHCCRYHHEEDGAAQRHSTGFLLGAIYIFESRVEALREAGAGYNARQPYHELARSIYSSK